MCIHNYLSGIGSSDHTMSSSGAVGKYSSSLLLSGFTSGGGASLKLKHLWVIHWSGGSAGFPFGIDMRMCISDSWGPMGSKEVSSTAVIV